jgi:hypothetical protein
MRGFHEPHFPSPIAFSTFMSARTIEQSCKAADIAVNHEDTTAPQPDGYHTPVDRDATTTLFCVVQPMHDPMPTSCNANRSEIFSEGHKGRSHCFHVLILG